MLTVTPKDEMAKGLSALLAHALYTGAAYPKELQNLEEGHVRAEDPEVLRKYKALVQEYDRAVLQLHQEMMEALEKGETAQAVIEELTRRHVQIALDSLRHELDLPLQWSEELKEELRQGLEVLRDEAAQDGGGPYAGELQEVIQILEEMLRKR